MEEETLGQKQRNLNLKVQNAIESNPSQKLEDIDYNQPDMDNLFKIDFACHTRNVQFILEVFKCQDILYVSRAIKHSVWLIKDQKYSYIINPKYLHTELFPFMLTPGKNKLLLSIRLNLKDPIRSEEFLNYLKDLDINMAMKWFSNCSVPFIESKLEDDIYRIPDSILLRLFCVSIDSLKRYVKNNYWYKPMLDKCMFLIGKHGDKYFDILDHVANNQIPKFNSKYTKLAMKQCPERLMLNFERYIRYIDEDVFVKYIKVECFQEFLKVYSSNSKVKVLFPKEKCIKILKFYEHNQLLNQLYECDVENLQKIKVILYIFRNKYLGDLKFRLHFINVVINKFHTHRFDSKTWNVLNDIFTKMGVYSEYKKHYYPCLKAALLYYVINNLDIPENVITNFNTFSTFKPRKNKLSEIENQRMFNYLLQFALNKIDTGDNDQMLLWLDNILLLLQDWKVDSTDYPQVTSKIDIVIEPLKAANNIEAIKKLYHRKRPWRKVLFNESFITSSINDATVHLLKHNPKQLHQQGYLEDLCLKEENTIKRFLDKVRIYWPHSLAKDLKNTYENQSTRAPSKNVLQLLSQQELKLFLNKNAPRDIQVDWDKLDEIGWRKSIAKNLHRSRPQPSMDTVLLYARGVYLRDSFSSIKAILHLMPPHQTEEYIKLQNWPEFVQKLCVLQAFKKFNKDEFDEFILSIWNNTQFCSVRADIFKVYFKSLKKYARNDMNQNRAYNATVTTLWDTFKVIVASLTDNECGTVYTLLSKFEAMPLVIRTEYCVMAYKFFSKLHKSRNSQKFMNKIVSKIEYNKVLPHLDVDLLADMIRNTITKRIWIEKLDWQFLNLLVKCIISEKEDDKIKVIFNKILKPVLEKAYEMWEVKILNLYMVKFNIYNFATWLFSSYKEILQHIYNPTPLVLIVESLQSNLSLSENYVLITNVKLAAEFMMILTKCERRSPDRLYERTAEDLSQLCIKTFCEDIALNGPSVIVLFYHSLQLMLNGFRVEKGTQYKVFNYMLDLSEGLSSELNVLVHVLVLQHCYTVSYGKEDTKGRNSLHNRIKAHPSPEVKANYSNLISTETCNFPYYSLFYNLLHDRIVI